MESKQINFFLFSAKGSLLLDTQHPEGLSKIRDLEGANKWQRPDYEDSRAFQRPVFTVPLHNLEPLNEGETAHFECRLIPVGDSTLKVDWYRNEVPIESSKYNFVCAYFKLRKNSQIFII